MNARTIALINRYAIHAVLLLGVLGYVLYFSPKLQEINTLNLEYQARTRTLSQRKAELASSQQYQVELDQLKAEEQRLSGLLRPLARESLVRYLENSAAQEKLSLSSINFTTPKKQQDYSEMEIMLSGKGRYPQILRLLSRIEQNAPVALGVRTLQMTQSGNDGVVFSLTMGAFYKEEL
jgi:Tfp pilus assembly protein PilO